MLNMWGREKGKGRLLKIQKFIHTHSYSFGVTFNKVCIVVVLWISKKLKKEFHPNKGPHSWQCPFIKMKLLFCDFFWNYNLTNLQLLISLKNTLKFDMLKLSWSMLFYVIEKAPLPVATFWPLSSYNLPSLTTSCRR